MTTPVSLSSGIRISGFEDLDTDVVQENWRTVGDFLASRKGPVRIDRVMSGGPDNALHIYVRERTWGEFFYEKLIAGPEELADIENEARAAIAHALDPFINTGLCLQDSGLEGAADRKLRMALRRDRLSMQWLQAAVLESSSTPLPLPDDGIAAMDSVEFAGEVELMPVNGLRKVPPGLSVLPFSPLTLICDCLFVDSAASKTGEHGKSSAFQRAEKAFKSALSGLGRPSAEARVAISNDRNAVPRDASKNSAYVTKLAPPPGLKHVEHLFVFDEPATRDCRQLKNAGFDAARAITQDWLDFYKDILLQAAIIQPFGSTVLEPRPSYWTTEHGSLKPVYTDGNIEGLALAALSMRDAGLKTGKAFQAIALAIPDAELMGRVERKLMELEDGLFERSTASARRRTEDEASASLYASSNASAGSAFSILSDSTDSDEDDRIREILGLGTEEVDSEESSDDILVEDEDEN